MGSTRLPKTNIAPARKPSQQETHLSNSVFQMLWRKWKVLSLKLLSDVGLPDGLQYPKTNELRWANVTCGLLLNRKSWKLDLHIYIYIYLDTASIMISNTSMYLYIFPSTFPYPFLIHLHKKKHLSIPYMRSHPIGTPSTQPDGSAMFKTSS